MAATRLLLLRSPFFLNFRNASRFSSLPNVSLHPHVPFPFLPPRPLPKPFLSPLFRFHSDSAAAASTEVFENPPGVVEGADAKPHPWPEWETFIEQLKSKGYFDAVDADPTSAEANEHSSDSASVSRDFNRLKAACLSFARERFDVLKSLCKKDIQAVVESGCPNLHRKAVNSAKRLRAYVRLDEGEGAVENPQNPRQDGIVLVCSGCNLRGSCDRAYVIAREDEVARTVDVVRILLSYAIDPLVLSGGEKPHGREHVESSARRLLSELIELSDTSPDPSLPKPAVKSPIEKQSKIRDRDRQFLNVEMKRGDWICSKCNFMNFSRNIQCLQCKEEGPKKVNFDEVEMKKGDWICSQCQFMNFARNKNCLRCQHLRPRRELNPGEWECPLCDFVNFQRNMVCLKCNCKRPKDGTSQYEDQIWRKPSQTGINRGDTED